MVMGSVNKKRKGRVSVMANKVCRLLDSSACASNTRLAKFSNPSFLSVLRTRAAFFSRMVLWRVSGRVALKIR
jgi:hypothetical protein